MWSINQTEITQTAQRFFNDYKKYEKEAQSQKMGLISMQVRYISEAKHDRFLISSLEK
jgi:hypothetical protein